jgi:hypothetical protein
MKKHLITRIAMLGVLAAALPSQAVEIDVPDYSLVPDGQNLTTTFQNTNVNTPNGGTVLPNSGTPVVYVVSTFTFGAASDAHLQWQFSVNETSALRLGVEIQDTGLVQFLGTGDSTRTSFNFNQDMAGQAVTLLAKLSYDANNNVTYGKSNAADDTIMNVWINPTNADVEGSGLSAGDMSTIWNSAGFNWFRQVIQNQLTPGTSGASSITNTTILTGGNATFSNALALATGEPPPTPGVVDVNVSTVVASPVVIPADAVTESTITVTLKDSYSDPVAGRDVTLEAAGVAEINPVPPLVSDAEGKAVFTVKSATPGTVVFTAKDVTADPTIVTIAQTASVTFVDSADADLSTVQATPLFVNADGSSTSTVTVTLLAQGNIPIEGNAVSLSGNPGNAVITPPGTQITDANGVATFTVSSNTPGTEVFTATDTTDSIVITQTASVNFVGPTSAGLSTVVASANSVVANGTTTSTITVSLKDADGFPAGGRDVTLAGSPGVAVIAPPTAVTTNAAGVATFTVSSNAQGTEVFAATATAGSVVITQTASVDFVDPSIPYAVNVNFNAFTGGNVPPGLTEVESELVGPAGGLGTRWNQFAANSSSGTLLDPTGIGTGVAFTTDFSEGRYDGTGATPMLRSTLTDFAKAQDAPTRTFTITGLVPNEAYDVWLAAFRNQGAAGERIYGRWVANNPTTSAGVQYIDNRIGQNGTTFVEGYNYIVFTGVEANESGQISFVGDAMGTAEGADAEYRQGLCGFQIAPAAGPPPPTTTLVIDLGTSPAGTEIEGGTFIGNGPVNLPLPALPPGSILRSITMNAQLEATDNGTLGNWASDLSLLLDPTPENPGGDFSVEITNGTGSFGGTVGLSWPTNANNGPVTPLVDTKTAADWSAVAPIDLATTGLFLGNAFVDDDFVAGQGGTWSGTITLTYDLVGAGSDYDTWSGGAAADIDSNGDGVYNGVAWALNAPDPNANAIGLLPILDNTSDPTYVIFKFNRSDLANDDANTTIAVEYGNDLVGWTTAVDDNDNVDIIVNPGSPTDEVLVKLKRSTLAAGGRIFARLNVVVTTP